MSETPLYAQLVAELGDPEEVVRSANEWLITWHAKRLREREPRDGAHGATRST